jgi:flagellar motor component MotA
MEISERVVKDIGVIKEVLTKELTISYYSILRDDTIKQEFIQAVSNSSDISIIAEEIIPLILEANKRTRLYGFLSLLELSEKSDDLFFKNFCSMIADLMDWNMITALYKPAFYFFRQDELIKNVLIHDGLMMCVTGQQPIFTKFMLNNMLGRHVEIESLKSEA